MNGKEFGKLLIISTIPFVVLRIMEYFVAIFFYGLHRLLYSLSLLVYENFHYFTLLYLILAIVLYRKISFETVQPNNKYFSIYLWQFLAINGIFVVIRYMDKLVYSILAYLFPAQTFTFGMPGFAPPPVIQNLSSIYSIYIFVAVPYSLISWYRLVNKRERSKYLFPVIIAFLIVMLVELQILHTL